MAIERFCGRMRRAHLISGIAMVAAFIASGAYLRWGVDLGAVGPEPRLVFISRHIYLMGPALVHLILAIYLRPVAGINVRLQGAGTIFLAISSALLVTAFVIEAMRGRGRTELSSLGIFVFWAGAMLHVLAPGVARLRGRAGGDR